MYKEPSAYQIIVVIAVLNMDIGKERGIRNSPDGYLKKDDPLSIRRPKAKRADEADRGDGGNVRAPLLLLF